MVGHRKQNYDSIEDLLKELIAAGKIEEAYTHSYRVYWQELVYFSAGQLKGYVSVPLAEGEDIAQQVFTEFWKTLLKSTYKSSKGTVRTFIYDIAKKDIIDKIRTPNKSKPGRDVDIHVLDDDGVQANYTSNRETIEQEDKKFKKKKLNCEWANLDSSDRQILDWFYKLELSTSEIAQLLNEKEGTIRTRLLRARAKLRKACNDDR